jgi:PRTRC genetic system protein E
MFSELLPLLTERTLFLTVARVDDSTVRVNVIPKRLKENDTGENALTTPLSITGTAEELGRELSVQLSGFVESLTQTSSNLAQLQEIHKSAVKAVEAENKKNLDSKRKVGTSQTPSKDEKPATGPVFKDGKPVFGSKNALVTETKGLFEEVSPTSLNGSAEVATGRSVNETSASGSPVQHREVMPEQLLHRPD